MTVTEAIDQVLQRTENAGVPTADYVQRRQRLLEYLCEVRDELWWLRDWVWKRGEAEVTVAAGAAKALLPLDFGSIGVYGGCFLAQDGTKLRLVPESEIDDTRQGGEHTDQPGIWALFDMDTATGRQYIQIPLNDGPVTLRLKYNRRPPTFDEGANVDNLKQIPEDFHQLVVIPGLRKKARESAGDARWKASAMEYESGKRFMLSEDSRHQGQPRRLPSFFGR